MRKAHVLTAGAGALALILTACSSSGGGTDTSTDTPSTSGQVSTSQTPESGGSTPAGTPIVVGTLGSYSGPQASNIAQSKAAITAWADALNANGGINGRPVKLIVKDDGGNVQTAAQDVKELVEQEHIVALVGEQSGSSASWSAYIQKKGIPVIGGNPVDLGMVTNPGFYAASGNLLADYYGLVQNAKQFGDKVGNVYCAELPACAATGSLLTAFGESLGVSVGYSSKAASSSADFTAICQGLKSAGVKSYTLGLAAATFLAVAKSCKQQGLQAKIVTSYVSDTSFLKEPAFDGMVIDDSVYPYWDESIPAAKEFHDAIAKYSPKLGSDSMPLNTSAMAAWVGGKLFETAVKASGSTDVTPDSIKKGLYALKDETLGGLTVPLNFKPDQPNLHNCDFDYKIQNGKFVALNGLKPTCAPDTLIAGVAQSLS